MKIDIILQPSYIELPEVFNKQLINKKVTVVLKKDLEMKLELVVKQFYTGIVLSSIGNKSDSEKLEKKYCGFIAGDDREYEFGNIISINSKTHVFKTSVLY